MQLQELDKQVSKLAFAVSCLESQGKLSSQTESNPRHNASAMTLMSGKVLELVPGTSCAHNTSRDKEKLDIKDPVETAPQKSFAVPPLFLGKLVQCKKERKEKKILDNFRKIPVAPNDQEKKMFTYPFSTSTYRQMSFELYNALATFQICMVSIFSDYVEKIIEVLMDDFTVYGFYRRFIKNFSKIVQPLCNLLQKDKEFKFDQSYRDAFDTLKHKLILASIV
ncbi:uncharacterized protein [Gossypium hirsutum]|uniref:Uncharacterized protein n=1 Tax=Gossypium hirsutum TaxID=3635 RepID=A0A1U8KID6_GOSHI|nr:uncharacterized protein LOC107917377 [Gossypium hirsutum]